MTADEIMGWVDKLSAAADAEERGRQARMGGAARAGSSGAVSGSGSRRGGRGVRPCRRTGSGCGFDPGPGVLLLELARAEIAKRRVQAGFVVDLINEARSLLAPLATSLKGTVNLLTAGRAKTGVFPLALRGDAQFGDLAPAHHRRLGTKRSIVV